MRKFIGKNEGSSQLKKLYFQWFHLDKVSEDSSDLKANHCLPISFLLKLIQTTIKILEEYCEFAALILS